jgi:heparinase II/III-like protein
MEPTTTMDVHRILIDGPIPDVAAIAAMLDEAEFSPMPCAADRGAWDAVAAHPWTADLVAQSVTAAERADDDGPAQARATDYLAYFRDGTRDAYIPTNGRPAYVAHIVAAECIEHSGRFMDTLLDLSWAICEETSWIMPPHMDHIHSADSVLPDVRDPGIDLRVATTGRTLAELTYLLRDEMDAVSPNWRARIQYELERQVVGPYTAGRAFWWDGGHNNWNAVCTSGVVGTALLGDFDTETRARVLHRALGSVGPFLAGFAADGGCGEGPGYWAYGMGNYSILAYYVHCATGGRVDLLADPRIPHIYAYPTKMILTAPQIVNFADCPSRACFRSGPVAWCAERLGVDSMVALASDGPARRGYFGPLDLCLLPTPAPFEPPTQSVLPEQQVCVARGAGASGEQLVLAARAGHNADSHNHNDVGAFIVHWRGHSLIADLGTGKYVNGFFGPKRYEFFATRSAGHNVPLVNGCEQRAGWEFQATGFDCEEADGNVRVAMDIAGAYPPEAELRRLMRHVTLRRGAMQRVELHDTVEFAGAGGAYELPLYTEGRFALREPGLVVAESDGAALRIEYDPAVLEAVIEDVEHDDGLYAQRFGPRLPRCRFRLLGTPQTADVRIVFVPLP